MTDRNILCLRERSMTLSRWRLLLLAAVVSALVAGTAATAYAATSHELYYESFETTNASWTPTSIQFGIFEWGTPTWSDGPMAAKSGVKCWGTDLATGPADDACEEVVSSAIVLPAVDPGQSLKLSYWAYSGFQSWWRYHSLGLFYTSSDGETWTRRSEFLSNMGASAWQEYQFDVTEYAGGPLYLKFHIDAVSTYYGDANRDSGLFVDDVKVTRYDTDRPITLSLTASEDAPSHSSCPWLYTWDGSGYSRDNDIYPVMRYTGSEGRDYYVLSQPLVERGGMYPIQVREDASEVSYTDYAGLSAVDHAAGVSVGTDASGHVAAYADAGLVALVSAIKDGASDTAGVLATRDSAGTEMYSGDTVELDFGDADVSSGARLVLRSHGFIEGDGIERPFVGRPALVVEVPAGGGGWTEVGRMLPRMDWSEGVFDLTGKVAGSGPVRVRVRSISHGRIYHLLDFAALSTGTEPAFTVTPLRMSDATQAGTDVVGLLNAADDRYVTLTPGNSFTAEFEKAPLAGAERDFLFTSEGYYVPKAGTYFIYTWDGEAWKMRSALSFDTEL
ncbi:MAG: hypothetical protein Q7W16_00455, partial [Coriobacteriia bacterium]|nr:hypothetical protein [Coriobacteriia bacterium]